MSSRFVSAGTIEEPTERDAEWLAAQQEIETNRRRKAEDDQQYNGKSLYDTLQANKDAKQEAFEESIRLKNQFRSLNEDEVEFLDSVLESTRAKEAALKRETSEQLEIFRKQQENATKALLDDDDDDDDNNNANATTKGKSGSPAAEEEQWATAARRRKRSRDKEVLKGLKIRKLRAGETQTGDIERSSLPAKETIKVATHQEVEISKPAETRPTVLDTTPTIPKPTVAAATDHTTNKGGGRLGLGYYDSDDD